MKILYWLADSFSERIGLAIVKVESNEDADIEKMLILVDGTGSGHYGLQAKLVGTNDFDIATYAKKRKALKFTSGQFGYNGMPLLKEQIRYYEVHVSRD